MGAAAIAVVAACDTKREDSRSVTSEGEVDTDTDADTDSDNDTGPTDADGDGVPAWQDCDDDDASVGGPGDWYLDADDDGFGDPETTEQACEAPEDHVIDGSDCDDSEASTNPAGSEICNGVDDDCDGLVDDEDDSLDSTTLDVFYLDADGDGWGTVSSTVSACTAPEGHVAEGGDCDDGDSAIHPDTWDMIDGVDNDCDGLVDQVPTSSADFVLEGATSSEHAGKSLAGMHDVNGDGLTDLLVSGWLRTTTTWEVGAAYLQYGPITGSMVLSSADAEILGTEDYQRLGGYVVLLGDVHGDGYDEVVVVAGSRNIPATDGGIYLFNGPISGSDIADNADLVIQGGPEEVGGMLAAGGDIDGDGLEDLILGDTPQDRAHHVRIIEGSSLSTGGTVILDSLGTVIETEEEGDNFGRHVAAAGDLDRDGLEDIVVGAFNHSSGDGCVYVFLTSDPWTNSATDASVRILGDNEAFGSQVAGGGDLTGDDIPDLAISASDYSAPHGSSEGAVYIVEGGTLGTVTTTDLLVRLAGSYQESLGSTVSILADIDGNGVDEIATGAIDTCISGCAGSA